MTTTKQKAWANYHGHSFFCDGHGSPEEYVKEAIKLDMHAIGISSHAPVPFFTEWNMDGARLPEYLDLVTSLKIKYINEIKILKSMEVDYIPNMAGPSHERVTSAGLDYVVGSVHFVDPFPDGTPFSIDDSTDLFNRGVNVIFDGDVREIIERYFELQREMLEYEAPDILGHMDKIRMHNRNRYFFDESAPWYRQQVYDTLKLAAEKNAVVEINTKFFSRVGLTFPSSEHFKWMKKNNIPVTLSSDAHRPENLLSGFNDVVGLLKSNGIDRLWQFNGDGFAPREFEKEGVVWE